MAEIKTKVTFKKLKLVLNPKRSWGIILKHCFDAINNQSEAEGNYPTHKLFDAGRSKDNWTNIRRDYNSVARGKAKGYKYTPRLLSNKG